MLETIATLKHLYERFNARDVEAVLAAMQPDVEWGNSTDGGHLVGHEAVRAYWTRQWAEIAPILIPEQFSTDGLGRVVIDGRLRVRDRSGTLLADGKEARRIAGRDYVLEYPIHADYALIKAERADRWGNLTYRKGARNFGPIMASAARCTVAQVREVVALGGLDPESVVTPGIFVTRVVKH